MAKLNERVVRCFGMLRNPEFEPLLQFLKESREDVLETLAQAVDERIARQYQGRALQLKELLSYVEDSPQLLSKVKGR